jgi:hypothetical protein
VRVHSLLVERVDLGDLGRPDVLGDNFDPVLDAAR